MVKATQSPNRLGPRKDHLRKRTVYDMVLKESPAVYAILEDEAREENLKVEFGATQSKKAQRIRVRLLNPQARLQTQGSAKAAGHDLYAKEERTILALGQEVVATGISITPPRGTYGRIAPPSGMAVKHQLAVNAGGIDSDYTGENKAVLRNISDQGYRIQNGDRIAQLIMEEIVESNYYQVPKLGETDRGQLLGARTPRKDFRGKVTLP